MNQTDPFGLLFDSQYWSNTLAELSRGVDDLKSSSQVQWADVKALAPSKYLQKFPCVVAAEKVAEEACAKAKKVYEEYAHVVEMSAFSTKLGPLPTMSHSD